MYHCIILILMAFEDQASPFQALEAKFQRYAVGLRELSDAHELQRAEKEEPREPRSWW